MEQREFMRYFDKRLFIPDLKAKTKDDVFGEMVEHITKLTPLKDQQLIIDMLNRREQLGSTGIGGGIGIPHGKLKGMDSLILGFGLSRSGIDFESMDGRPTHIFFLLVTPENSTGLHLKLLAQISRLLKKEIFKESLLKATDRDEVLSIIQAEDEDF